MKKLWRSWKKFSAKIAKFEANLILSILYLLVFLPLGLFLQIFSRKTFEGPARNKNSYWQKIENSKQDLGWAKRQ